MRIVDTDEVKLFVLEKSTEFEETGAVGAAEIIDGVARYEKAVQQLGGSIDDLPVKGDRAIEHIVENLDHPFVEDKILRN